MKNKKGITLITLTVTLMAMMIIATTSILVGNKLVLQSKQQKEEQNLESVKLAISRIQSIQNMSGVVTPTTSDLPGIQNPIIGKNGLNQPIYAGNDWYLLEESDLKELGLTDISEEYIVNYQTNSAYLITDPDLISKIH